MATRRRTARRETSSKDEMSQLLIAVRRPGERSQTEAARLTGLTQAKISRAEQGRFPLSPAEAEAFADGLGATPEQRRRLLELATARAAASAVGRRQLIDNAHVIQRRIADLQATERTKILRGWVPELVPGILQTEDYTRAVLGREPSEEWWVPRRAQKEILDWTDRQVHLIVGEAALRFGLGSPAVMVAQLGHLAEALAWPRLRLGIVLLDVVQPFLPPHGFYVYGEHAASQATEVGTTFITEAKDVEQFVADHAALEGIAVYGEEARRAIERAAGVFG